MDLWEDFVVGVLCKRFMVKPIVDGKAASGWIPTSIERVHVYSADQNQIIYQGQLNRKPRKRVFASMDSSMSKICLSLLGAPPNRLDWKDTSYYLLHSLKDELFLNDIQSHVFIYKQSEIKGGFLSEARKDDPPQFVKGFSVCHFLLFLMIAEASRVHHVLALEVTEELTELHYKELLDKFCWPCRYTSLRMGWLLFPYLADIRRYLSSKWNESISEKENLPNSVWFYPKWTCASCETLCDCPGQLNEYQLQYITTSLPYDQFLKSFNPQFQKENIMESKLICATGDENPSASLTNNSSSFRFLPSNSSSSSSSSSLSTSISSLTAPPSTHSASYLNNSFSSIPSRFVPSPAISSPSLSLSILDKDWSSTIYPDTYNKIQPNRHRKRAERRPIVRKPKENTEKVVSSLIPAPIQSIFEPFIRQIFSVSNLTKGSSALTELSIVHQTWQFLQQEKESKTLHLCRGKVAYMVGLILRDMIQSRKMGQDPLTSISQLFPPLFPVRFPPKSLEYYIYETLCRYAVFKMTKKIETQRSVLSFQMLVPLRVTYPDFIGQTMTELILSVQNRGKQEHKSEIYACPPQELQTTLEGMVKKGILISDALLRLV
jgi:hypothetical protein